MESKHFNRALDAKLIELVRARPVLYKRTDVYYNDNFFKDMAWEEVSNEVGKTVTDCKTRWRTIRDSYKKNKKKQGNSKYNDKKLKFLDASFRPLQRDVVEVDIVSINRKEEPKTKKDRSLEVKEKSIDVTENIPTNTMLKNQEHPIQLFFKSMASTVMTFPNYLIAETRVKVCNLVTKMELRAIAETSKQSSAHQYTISEDSGSNAASSPSSQEINANQDYDDIQERKEIVFCD